MKVIIFLILIFLSNNAHSQQTFELSGKLPFTNAEISLISEDSVFTESMTITKDGKFKLTGNLNQENSFVSLVVRESGKFIGKWQFFISPSKIAIEILKGKNSGRHEIKYFNVPYVEEMRLYDSLKEINSKKSKEIFEMLQMSKAMKKQNVDSLEEVRSGFNNDFVTSKIEFIKTNQNYYYSLYFFYNDIIQNLNSSIRLSTDSLIQIFFGFNEQLQNTTTGKSIKDELTKRSALSLGHQMPAFSFADSSFNQFDLSELYEKKYLLLGFWDAGCLPCIKSFPILKSLYAEYQSFLEIVSVSLDHTEERWKGAFKKYGLPWINTCNIPKYVASDLNSLYNIKFIPQYFLIDRSGKLIYHNIQSFDTDDYIRLKNLLSIISNQEKNH